jgi:prevent-host-death family protein
MSDEIASRELRNDTAGVLRRVQAGETLAVTVNGHHVADLVPAQRSRRGWISRDVIVARLRRTQADPGLRDDLAWIAGDTTDDLPPIR